MIYGMRPIPENYFLSCQGLGSWESEKWSKIISPELIEGLQANKYS